MDYCDDLSLSDLPNENWLDIKNYEGYYRVSNLGRIKTVERKILSSGRGKKFVPSKIRKQKNHDGYRLISLCKDGIVGDFLVHRVVASAFIPNPNNLPAVNHKNFIRHDNSVNNLEWISTKDNNKHSFIHGKYKAVTGINNFNSKLNEELVFNIRVQYLSIGKTVYEMARDLNVCPVTINNVIRNKIWRDDEYELVMNTKFFKRIKEMNRNTNNKNSNSKFTEDEIREIRRLYSNREKSSVELAKIYNVSKEAILAILNRKTWKYLI